MRKSFFYILMSLFCFASCKTDSLSEPIRQLEESEIDSIYVILMKEGILFPIKVTRSDFLINHQNDLDSLYCDSILVEPKEIRMFSKLLNELPASDTLSYYSSQVSYELKKTGDVIRFIQNSMDNQGVLLLFHQDSIEYVWLSNTQIERGNIRYEMTDTIKRYIHKLNSLSDDSSLVTRSFQ